MRLGRAAARTSRATVALAGLAAMVAFLATALLGPEALRETLRETALDRLLPMATAPTPPTADTTEVVIVDIDRASLARLGPWPWPRARLAELIAAITAAVPVALAVDLLIAEPDRLSPAALARALGAATGRADITAMAAGLADADEALALALAATPSALGVALEPDAAGDPVPTPAILQRGTPDLPAIWRARGVIGPPAGIAAGAQGFGVLALAPDAGGIIRRVPLLVATGTRLRPGLAVEAARLSQRANALLLGPGATIQIGDIAAPLGPDATLRLVPRIAWADRSLSAAAVLTDPTARTRLAGRIVLLGGSAPELGGLRATPDSPATPTLHIQADAVDTILRGPRLHRPSWLAAAELLAAGALGLLGIALTILLRPLPALAFAVAAALAWLAATALAIATAGLLPDPAFPPLVLAAGFTAAALARFARDEWRARRLRASFEQHLAPEVVRRIAADPAALRLKGEFRDITAFFTDIEGFTSMTERAEPADLVALLDAYFDMAGRVVTAHGGMIEKIVGDAVHAIFNAPFALDDHPRRAIDCAVALLAQSEQVRRSALGLKLVLGRTRIGIETGMAIVGDVGGSRKLDYTAHGNVMNTAARLEAANKELGSAICIGPGTASRLDPALLRPIGNVALRGLSQPLAVFTPASLP